MPAPSQLAIATSSLQRLGKEEASYHKELEQQKKSIEKLEKNQTEEAEDERGNQEFQLKQEVCSCCQPARCIASERSEVQSGERMADVWI